MANQRLEDVLINGIVPLIAVAYSLKDMKKSKRRSKTKLSFKVLNGGR